MEGLCYSERAVLEGLKGWPLDCSVNGMPVEDQHVLADVESVG